MMRATALVLIAITTVSAATVSLRTRAQVFKGGEEWQEAALEHSLQPHRTAIVICDMWDKHWCRGATERVNRLAAKMEPLLQQARRSGVLIIHAPSDTMNFYASQPQRQSILNLKRTAPAAVRNIDSPKLPIDDSDGGCDTPGDSTHKAWSRQHPGITIAPNDLISDNGEEIYTALKLRGITDLLVMGVHTNMCVLNRTFAIKQMTKWGMRCMLVRDLTDAMYDPKDAPYVSHDRGTELVIEYIEKYWCPTVLSRDLMDALAGKTR
jgi:nicotinamidase-related amidase